MNVIGWPVIMLTAAAPLVASTAPAPQVETAVPFTIDQIFGSRPVVEATIRGNPYRLVVHANAGSYLQINHAEAAKVGAYNLKHQGAYGISEPGKVSDLGRDDGLIDQLSIGSWSVPSAPVAVFEVPAGASQGMLGLPFLHDNNVILDFGRNRLRLPGPKPSASLAKEMASRGYTAHSMTLDAKDGRYLVEVTINGARAPMVVSTVASIDLDMEFAKRAAVTIGRVAGSYGGPSGATGKVYETANPITLSIGPWSTRPGKVTITDTYAYSKAPRPADANLARGGALGADFMIANHAVIDFGNSIIYLKNNR